MFLLLPAPSLPANNNSSNSKSSSNPGSSLHSNINSNSNSSGLKMGLKNSSGRSLTKRGISHSGVWQMVVAARPPGRREHPLQAALISGLVCG